MGTVRAGGAAARAELHQIRLGTDQASAELGQIAGWAKQAGVRSVLRDVADLQRAARRGEGELRLLGGRAALLESLEVGIASEGEVSGSEGGTGIPADFTFGEEDLARIGTALDPTKPPPQNYWSEELVNTLCALGRQQGGVTDAEGHAHSLLAGQLLEGQAIELGAAEIAVALKAAGIPLEKVDPHQLASAARYVNTATNAADQQEKLRKTLDNFQVLTTIGAPQLTRQQMTEQLWAIARVPGHALENLSDTELRGKYQEILTAVNSGPGRVELKVGKHDLKFTVGEGGQVTDSETNRPSFLSRVGGFFKKIAPIALTVASFIPVTAPFARIAQGAISLAKSIRAGSVLGVATAAAGGLAGAASRFFQGIEGIANSAARALQGVSAVKHGRALTGLANLGGAVASGIANWSGDVGSSLAGVQTALADASDKLAKAATGVEATRAYARANRDVAEARQALERAQASGDSQAVAEARERLARAEQARSGALLGGLGSIAGVAADLAGQRRTPGLGEPQDRPASAAGPESTLRAVSRGLSISGDVATRDWESAGVNALGLGAAIEGPSGRTRTLSLRNASNLADAALGQVRSNRAEKAASAAVERAEAALEAARLAGDESRVAEAEHGLREARRAAEEALMGGIAAADSVLRTAQGIGTEHQERQRATEIRQAAAALGANLLSALRSPHSNEADREAALAQLLELGLAGAAYDEALASGDPARMRAARELFQQTQDNLGPPPAIARVASVGVTDASRTVDAAEPDSVLAHLEAVEGEGLTRSFAIAEWTEKEFKAHPERFAHALTEEEQFFLQHYVSTLGRSRVEAAGLSTGEAETAHRMFGSLEDPLDAYANWRNQQTIITNYALTQPDTVAYLGSLYRVTRDVLNPPHFLAERGYQVTTGTEAFTGENTGRLQPALELAAAWAIVRLTGFVIGRATDPGPAGGPWRVGQSTARTGTAEGEVTSVVSPSGLRVTIRDGRPVAWEWNVGPKGHRGTGYRDVEVAPGSHRGHVKSVGEGAGINTIDDGPLNVVQQSPMVNLSNVRRFESWRIRTAQGEYVKAELQADGMVRVRIPSRNVDVVFDPNALSRFPDGWFLQPGSTWR